ncbi:MAG: bifunctional metallophosphatase/5'-nucleotidase [Bacteroidales bacterium]|nr:bifunctional metallophosphatase/5'-nucleotidase [Bacteroidales bacterium]
MSNIKNKFCRHFPVVSRCCATIMLCLSYVLMTGCCEEKEADLTLLYVTDVHGLLLSGDYYTKSDNPVTMANFSTFLNQVRAEKGADHTILLCGGDLNEGQPANYYYNNVAKDKEHISAQVMNYFGFDAVELGAKDISAGRDVWKEQLPAQCKMPYLCANLLDEETKQCQLKPYTIIERQGFRIAILGLIDPNDCRWLSPDVMKGLKVTDLVGAAAKWVNHIREEESPDFIIGLFAAGTRNQSLLRVPGIDVFLLGADHRSLPVNNFRVSSEGDSVLDVQPFPRLEECAQINLHLARRHAWGSVERRADVKRVRLSNYKPDSVFINHFTPNRKDIDKYMNMKIGNLDAPMTYSDALFGPSALVDLMHEVQREATGAAISITNNCAEEVDFARGAFTTKDLFHLFKHNYKFWKFPMKGEEIHSFLEAAASAQFNQMSEETDHVLAFRFNDFKEVIIGPSGPEMTQQKFKFCSASGIRYTVDVTKPKGERVQILGMSDGTEFDSEKSYEVVMNEYLASGGGNYIFQIGWKRDTALNALISKTDDDARTCMINYIKKHGTIRPKASSDWSIIPVEFCKQARKTDAKILQRYMSPM